MKEAVLIQSSAHQPTMEEISSSIAGPVKQLWDDLNAHIRSGWKASPRITFSACSGKPGWNVKYKKSGKSLCTLYPASDGFVALVVVKLETVPEIMARASEFMPCVINLVANGKPYIGTLWLMIQVTDSRVLDDVKRLLDIKCVKRGLEGIG